MHDFNFYDKHSKICRASIRFYSELTPHEVYFGEQVAAQYVGSGDMNDYRQQLMETLVRSLVVDALTQR